MNQKKKKKTRNEHSGSSTPVSTSTEVEQQTNKFCKSLHKSCSVQYLDQNSVREPCSQAPDGWAGLSFQPTASPRKVELETPCFLLFAVALGMPEKRRCFNTAATAALKRALVLNHQEKNNDYPFLLCVLFVFLPNSRENEIAGFLLCKANS